VIVSDRLVSITQGMKWPIWGRTAKTEMNAIEQDQAVQNHGDSSCSQVEAEALYALQYLISQGQYHVGYFRLQNL
jgi:hypothetical protein